MAGMASRAAVLSWHTSPGDWIGVLSRSAGCADVELPSSGDGLGAHWRGTGVWSPFDFGFGASGPAGRIAVDTEALHLTSETLTIFLQVETWSLVWPLSWDLCPGDSWPEPSSQLVLDAAPRSMVWATLGRQAVPSDPTMARGGHRASCSPCDTKLLPSAGAPALF